MQCIKYGLKECKVLLVDRMGML